MRVQAQVGFGFFFLFFNYIFCNGTTRLFLEWRVKKPLRLLSPLFFAPKHPLSIDGLRLLRAGKRERGSLPDQVKGMVDL